MGRKVLNWDSPFFTVFKAILCAGFSSGMRKAEMTLAAGDDFDATHLSRASITWILKGCPVASPTVAQLKALVTGDFCGIKPAGAKNDPSPCTLAGSQYGSLWQMHRRTRREPSQLCSLRCPYRTRWRRSFLCFRSIRTGGPFAKAWRTAHLLCCSRRLCREKMSPSGPCTACESAAPALSW